MEALVEGLAGLAERHDFDGLKDLMLSPADAARRLREARDGEEYTAMLWAALVSDAAVARDGKKAERTPLCLMFGQGHQHFLSRLASVPRRKAPPPRGAGRRKDEVSEIASLGEALFSAWERPDATFSFRWDPQEDVRYALRARDPTDARTKDTTQHGANRLAAIGLSCLTVVPRRRRNEVRLEIVGGSRLSGGDFVFTWPIWREPFGLAGIRALLGHPRLDEASTRMALGVVELRRARRISAGKFMNFTAADTVEFGLDAYEA